MRIRLPKALGWLAAVLLLCGSAFATTYYIAANGVDTNNGTTKTTPWLHAPGMTNFSGSYTSAAGDRIIFRGGDSWHFGNSSATVYTGGSWSWTWNGTSTSCVMDPTLGTVVLTSCIYIGVDQTWYAGGSWVRPIFNFDNPTNAGFVSSCTYNDDNLNGFSLISNYVQIDNLEFTGYCTDNSSSGTGMVNGRGTPLDFSYDYFHGWTFTTGTSANQARVENCNGSGCTGFTELDHVVIDGSDSAGATTPYFGSMNGFGACTLIQYSVIRYIANFCVESSGNTGQAGTSGAHIYHDNLFEYLYNAGHGNIIEMISGNPGYSFGPVYFYNNVIRHFNEGIGIDLVPNSAGKVYMFNNVIYDNGHGSNCIGASSNGGGTGITTYFYNNTVDSQVNSQNGAGSGGCTFGQASIDTFNAQNNHFINYNTTTNCTGSCGSGYYSLFATGGTINDNGDEVWQTEATANGQGFVGCQGAPTCSTGNSYAETSSSNTTYHFGNNNTSLVATFSPADSAYGSGTTGSCSEISYGGGEGVSCPVITANARGTTWDAGAYEFSGGGGGPPLPPTNLTVTVSP